MIQRIKGIDIEIKWHWPTCAADIHVHNAECGAQQFFWRVADRLHSVWHGPFETCGKAVANAEEKINNAPAS